MQLVLPFEIKYYIKTHQKSARGLTITAPSRSQVSHAILGVGLLGPVYMKVGTLVEGLP